MTLLHIPAFVVTLCIVSAVTGACASINQTRLETRTGGVDLTLYVRDGTGAESYYEVNREGMLSYGGGLSARLWKTTWSGDLTPEEVSQLRALLIEHDWFQTTPSSSSEPPEQLYRLALNAPQQRKTFRVKGHSPELEPIRQLLFTAARRRLEPELKTLPQPSIQQQ